MNQILYTGNKKSSKNNKIFKIQFIVSTLLIIISVSLYFINYYYQNKDIHLYEKMLNSYNISKLYSNNTNSFETYELNGTTFTIIGFIEIPKIDISYPILSEINDDLLKIAPCRLSGPLPNKNGNLCIAGHNYDNSKFFSKIYLLNINDEIIIKDINNNKNSYFVFEKSEVSEQDLSPLTISDGIYKQITLITCNNITSNRIIIKAKP